ncbi:MAG: BolA family protein [Gammaproteobacteria bacterium]|nr:MAG: BolA family protein [Gammaproteobacteria bacterium]
MTATRSAAIRARLQAALTPIDVEVTDESHLHRGHAGARDGRGHFRVRVISECFSGLNRIERHRLVYDALGALMQTDIHALTVSALTREEAAREG